MNLEELQTLWRETLRSSTADPVRFEQLAEAVVDVYRSGDRRFRQHIKNRFNRVKERTSVDLDPDKFDIEMSRTFVADEIGFTIWNELMDAASDMSGKPILFHYAVAAMDRGDFTALEEAIGPDRFHDQIVEWFERGFASGEQETFDELFTAACMLGHERAAAYLLEKDVDPYAGMKTGLSGFHYAASSGRLNVIKLLIKRGVPMEVKNMYGGTVFEQAIWSAVNEWRPDHAAIVEALVEAGAEIDEGYAEWWDKQNVSDPSTKDRIAKVLDRHKEFHRRISEAKRDVSNAESNSDKKRLADSLKSLGNILRQLPFLRDEANEAYSRAAELYHQLKLPLEEAWVKRHIGINHEYAERLHEAERYYDEALSIYRVNAKEDSLDYANTVRYPAVIKNRLGMREESRALWEEAAKRYEDVSMPVGVAEAAAWLTIFAIEAGNLELARSWFAKASDAADRANDGDTFEFIGKVSGRLEGAKG
jgi:ankyrin repeat protein